MTKHYYIKQGAIYEYGFKLDGRYSLGATYEDSLNDKYVPLSKTQVEYHKEHPDAPAYEVWTMQEQAPYTPTLEDVKARKIAEIEQYDTSGAVNSFILNSVPVWIPRDTRVSVQTTTQVLMRNNQSETVLWLGETRIEISCATLISLLDAIEIYALEAYNTTAQHKINVSNLETTEAVEAYDHTIGYPKKLSFNI